KERALKTVQKLTAELESMDQNLNSVADLFIREYGNVQEKKIRSELDQAKLEGTYSGICYAFKSTINADRDRIPLYIEKSKDLGEVFLIQDRVESMKRLTKAFQSKCKNELDWKFYEHLSVVAEKYIKKFD